MDAPVFCINTHITFKVSLLLVTQVDWLLVHKLSTYKSIILQFYK